MRLRHRIVIPNIAVLFLGLYPPPPNDPASAPNPCFHLFSADFAAPDREKLLTVFINAKRDEAVLQYDDARRQQTDQVHHMLPANPVPIAQILLRLLELRQYVGFIGAVNMPREKDVPNVDQLRRKRPALFHQRRVEAFRMLGFAFRPKRMNFPISQ
jgi:hypothetical protein